MRNRLVDGLPIKIVGRLTTAEVLEAMIPAIMEIDGGWGEAIQQFIGSANAGLEKLGTLCRFKAALGSGGTHVEGIAVTEIHPELGEKETQAVVGRMVEIECSRLETKD